MRIPWCLYLYTCLILFTLYASKVSTKKVKQQSFSFSERFFRSYRTLDEINQYMYYLSKAKCNATVTLLKIGHSVEGRPIRLIRIEGNKLLKAGNDASYENEAPTEKNRGLLVTAAVHGREWITPAAVLYTASKIIEAYGRPGNEAITEALNHATLHLVPIVNPDGYVFTWRTHQSFSFQRFRLGTHTSTRLPRPAPLSRLWRGNRRKLLPGLYGIDLNRNWGTRKINWGQGVTKIHSRNFQGPSGFSEPELKAIRDYSNKREDINGFLDVHCCSQNVIAPFSLTPYNHTTAMKFAAVGSAYAAVLTNASGRHYSYTWRKKERQKFSSGISSGWGINEMGWEDSFTIELGGHFIMPAKSIISRSNELLAAVKLALVRSSLTMTIRHVKVIPPMTISKSVAAWQEFLRNEGFLSRKNKIQNVFSSSLVKATKGWQASMGLETTGFVDPETSRLAQAKGFRFVSIEPTKPARARYMRQELQILELYSNNIMNGNANDDNDDYLNDNIYVEYDESENKTSYESNTVEEELDDIERMEIQSFMQEDVEPNFLMAAGSESIDTNGSIQDAREIPILQFRTIRTLKNPKISLPTSLSRLYASIGAMLLFFAAVLFCIGSVRFPKHKVLACKLKMLTIWLTFTFILLEVVQHVRMTD